MFRSTRARVSALSIGAALTLGAAAGPTSAQTTQEGLVNVNVENVTAQVPIGIAANVCDVNANVLAEQLRNGGAECDAGANSIATAGPNAGGPTPPEGAVHRNASGLHFQRAVY